MLVLMSFKTLESVKMLLYVLATFFIGAFCFNPEGKNKKIVSKKVKCITTTKFLTLTIVLP